MAQQPQTRDGASWTAENGWSGGLPCIGAIHPREYRSVGSEGSDYFEVIVIGAGYAGLVAARDLALQEFKVLLLEGRDRIGGRTYTTNINGFPYEMGGQWIHWHQPHLYREISLYGMDNDICPTATPGGSQNYCSLNLNDVITKISHDEEGALFLKLWRLFCDVDGTALKSTIPYPFNPLSCRVQVESLDKFSARDRLDQINHLLTDQEMALLEAILHQLSGSPLEQMGFLDAMQWWALGDYHASGLNDYGLVYKISGGQSRLARRLFDHATSTRNLSYAFDIPVKSISEDDGIVTVTSRGGQMWKSHSVICTIPLNVLSDIVFSPPLAKDKFEAIQQGHPNCGNKVHVDILGPDLVTWSGFAHPGKGFTCAFADNMTPSGNTHLCVFGPNVDIGGVDMSKQDITKIKEAFAGLHPADIDRVTYHDWAHDEFSKGTWSFYPPGFGTKYFEALQHRHMHTHFASADWANGWRGWIDGAIQQGTRTAYLVAQELRCRKEVKDL